MSFWLSVRRFGLWLGEGCVDRNGQDKAKVTAAWHLCVVVLTRKPGKFSRCLRSHTFLRVGSNENENETERKDDTIALQRFCRRYAFATEKSVGRVAVLCFYRLSPRCLFLAS